MTPPKRTGASLVQTIQTASTHRMVTVGFTPSQAARIIKVRRVLPLVEDRRAPCIDARKLWAKIGKPHGRFNVWAAVYIKPLLAQGTSRTFAGISAKVSPVALGRPRTDYTLSRDVAANLAMMANTAEGADVRAYFLDMEDLALQLTRYDAVRVSAIVATDNRVTHLFTRKAGDAAKAGKLPRASIHHTALEKERLLKATVCEIVTGHHPGYWRDTFGRGVRDVLDTEDIQLYSRCYDTAQVLIESGVNRQAPLVTMLSTSFGGRVSPAKYLKAHPTTEAGVSM